MAVIWKKVLLSGDVVNADINASAGIVTSKLSGAISSITGHGLATAAWKSAGALAGYVPLIGTNLGASKIVETNASSQLVSIDKGTAYNKAFGTIAGSVAEGDHNHNLGDLDDVSASPGQGDAGFLEWDEPNGKWALGIPQTAFNKAFGLLAGDVAEGNHTHNYNASYHPYGGALDKDFAVKNLTVAGDITQNSVTELLVEDKTISLANGAHTDLGAEGAGIVVDSSGDDNARPTIKWTAASGWTQQRGETLQTGNGVLGVGAVFNQSGAPTQMQIGDIWNKQNGDIYIAIG